MQSMSGSDGKSSSEELSGAQASSSEAEKGRAKSPTPPHPSPQTGASATGATTRLRPSKPPPPFRGSTGQSSRSIPSIVPVASEPRSSSTAPAIDAPAHPQAVRGESRADVSVSDVASPLAAASNGADNPARDVGIAAAPSVSSEIPVDVEPGALVSGQRTAEPAARLPHGLVPPTTPSVAAERRFSLEPTAQDVELGVGDSHPRRLQTHHWAVIGGGVVLTVGILALTATVNGHGSLLVTGGQGEAAAPGAVRLLVDGVLRCDELPCRVDELSPGRHVLRAESDQRKELAMVEVDIRADSETPVPLLLVQQTPEQARTSQHSPSRPAEGAEGSPGALPESMAIAPREQASKRQPRTLRGVRAEVPPAGSASGAAVAEAQSATTELKPSAVSASGAAVAEAQSATTELKPPTAADGNGTLVVTSEPSAIVIVDGEPRGWTPRTLTLPAGPHAVTVQHPELGSQSADVTVRVASSTTLRIDL